MAVLLAAGILLTAVVGAVLVGRRRLVESHQQYARRLLVVRDRERAILAGEVHSEMSQRIAALGMELSGWTPPVSPEAVASASEELQALGSDLRALAHRIHPSVAEKHGLDVALQQLRAELRNSLGFDLDLELTGTPMPKGDLGHGLYRIVQEALNNTRNHAEVDSAEVRVVVGMREVTVEIEDAGIGFDQTTDRGRGQQGLGLLSMHDRAALAGATLDVRSRPGAGTLVRVRVPHATDHRDLPA